MKEQFGKALRDLRKRKHITQEQLADHLGIAKANISRYEAGLQAPELERLEAMGQLLGLKPSEILAYAEGQNLIVGPEIKGTVPLISWVQAGHWQDVIDNMQPGEGERIETTWRPRQHTYALRVRGDSMEPKFPDGCIIIVEPDEVALAGSFVIVRQNGGEATFKQLVQDGNRNYLKPLNPRYPIMELSTDAVVCGVVKRVEMDV